MYLLSDEPDITGLYINQTIKVRFQKITEAGIEVITCAKGDKLGFIPFRHLATNISQLFKEKSLYVRYLDYNKGYLLLTEKEA